MSEGEANPQRNHDVFRDCLLDTIVTRLSPVKKQRTKKTKADHTSTTSFSKAVKAADDDPALDADPSELAEFSHYLADEIFPSLPEDLRNLTYHGIQSNEQLSDKWSLPLSLVTLEEMTELMPGSVNDSLEAYGLATPPKSDVQSFIAPAISAYVSSVLTPPPKWVATKVTECEICDRDWVPMTYHHLIPKQVHTKVLKRGWHDEQQLNSVAWLCRACHTFVHGMASNEELAREWYTVDKICSREDVQKWAVWVRRVRWKKS